jgi:hypothetical protein
MKSDPTSPKAGFATWIYCSLLKLYPAAFRRRYEGEMLRIFQEEWSRAAGEGAMARSRYVLHLAWDVFRTVPSEWSMAVPRLVLMTLAATGLAIVYLSFAPIPFLLKVLGWACLNGTFAVFMVVFSRSTRAALFKAAFLGVLVGLVLAPINSLNPKPVPPPESPLVLVTDPSLTGREIYGRMEAVYRQARTYADEGEVQTVYRGAFSRIQIKTFGTAFVRDGGFRFGFRDQFDRLDAWNEYVIWKEGGTVKKWWTIEPQVTPQKDLDYALGGAAGVSELTSVLVPGLLQSDKMSGGPLSDGHTQIELLGTQRVDGRETFKLQLAATHRPALTLWIDARSYLIVRISRSSFLLGKTMMRVDETIIYHPQLNAPVDAVSLTFQPGSAPTILRWQYWFGGRIYAMIVGFAMVVLTALVNVIHRRALRRRWRGKKELWLAPIGRRMSAGYVGLFAICAGLWLGGVELDEVSRNLMLAQLMFQCGFSLYVIHRRSRGHARFTAVA